MIITRGFGYEAAGSEFTGGTIDAGIIDTDNMSVSIGADSIAISIEINTDDDVTVTVT